jgi:hypothetical protein
MFKPKGPYCQSCGMPLSKDAKGGGTEKDGSKSKFEELFIRRKFNYPLNTVFISKHTHI